MVIKVNVNPEEAGKLQKVLEDEAFVSEIFALQTPEEVQSALKEKDINLTIDEITELANAINKALTCTDSEELSEEALEGVAGGGVFYVKIKVKTPSGWEFEGTVIW